MIQMSNVLIQMKKETYDKIIKNSFLYKKNKDYLLEIANNILYKNIEKENNYEFIRNG